MNLMNDMSYIIAALYGSRSSKPIYSGICVFNGMWTHLVWSSHNVLHAFLKCCLEGNWVMWIIGNSRWALFGFVVVTKRSKPCALIYEWCIKRSNQDIQYAETKGPCAVKMDITLHLINGNRPRWFTRAGCQTLDHIWNVRLKIKQKYSLILTREEWAARGMYLDAYSATHPSTFGTL